MADRNSLPAVDRLCEPSSLDKGDQNTLTRDRSGDLERGRGIRAEATSRGAG